MAAKKPVELKKGQIEVTWLNGQSQIIQTEGMTYNTGAIVLGVDPRMKSGATLPPD
ncbi:MAG TPA: hypothetical protein VFX15_02990 [Actinomycetes bacterium]|nr:hypothetical protein [Actinomycetes bacterium]